MHFEMQSSVLVLFILLEIQGERSGGIVACVGASG